MRLITVARKPLDKGGSVARNILAYGTGGLNIDACRVAGAPELPGSANISPEDNQSFDRLNATAGRRAAAYIANPPSGRWPANVILQHASACRVMGQQDIRAKQLTAGRRIVQWGVGQGDCTYQKGTGRILSTESGKETVDVWECVDGCPVKTLDGQAQTHCTQAIRKVSQGIDIGIYSPGVQTTGEKAGFSDSGGASRFFKQVRGEE